MAVDRPGRGEQPNIGSPEPGAEERRSGASSTGESAQDATAAGERGRGGPGDPGAGRETGEAPVTMASDQPSSLPPVLVPRRPGEVMAPIVVPNSFWTSTNPLAYDGGQPAEITHLHEYGETDLGRRDDARWAPLDLIPTKADYILDLIRANSLWPLLAGLACCAFEMMSMATSKNDVDRWGMFPFRASPRQADVLIAAGTLTTKMAGPFLRLWEQMPEPKWLVAMGDCTVSGGRYKRSYSVVEGIDRIMPVDIYVPGCPPRPEGLMFGMLKLAQLVKERRGHWTERQISPNVPDAI